jgi:Cu-Zn family superoxide dismutase
LFVDPGAGELTPVQFATAVLHPTRGNQATGVVHFRQAAGAGVDVFAAIDGLPEGRHAYHVHVHGDCSAPDAASAGPHFHFDGSAFDRSVNIVTGNLGELVGGGERTATHQSRQAEASLQGRFSIIGRAVVIHARPNDHAHPPDGDAGDRLACGVIGVGTADVWKAR